MKLPPSCPSPGLFGEVLERTGRALAGTADFDFDTLEAEETPPAPVAKTAEPEHYAVLRGRCDAQAMKARFHDPALHRGLRPRGPVSMALFERLEEFRIEACAARRLRGVGINLAAGFDHARARRGNNVLETDAPAALPNAVALAARERLLNALLDAEAARLVARWRDEIDRRCGRLILLLAANTEDQRTFGRHALELIESLELHDDPQRGPQAKAAEIPAPQQTVDGGSETVAGVAGSGDGEGPERAGRQADGADRAEDDGTAGRGDGDAGTGEGSTVVPLPREGYDGPDRVRGDSGEGEPERPPGQHPAGRAVTYGVWTTRFDEIVHPRDLLGRQQLETLRRQLEAEVAKHRQSAVKLASRLQNSLRTLQKRSWTFDLDDGLLDTTRLARLVTDPLSPLVYKQERDSTSRDTVISFLVDNSGSMRGRPIALAAMFVDILCQALERCQVATEILGFTTREWRGGETRRHWRDAGKPPRPGRLSDLRHVIYKTADEPWRRARQTLGGMLWPQLLKENIDGEALQWAHARLAGRPEQRRILVMISDGVPADDSTLTANTQDYLDAHLRRVVDWIESQSSVELVAVGMGHDVGRIYRRSTTITDAGQLGDAIAHQIVELLGRAPHARYPFVLSSLAG